MCQFLRHFASQRPRRRVRLAPTVPPRLDVHRGGHISTSAFPPRTQEFPDENEAACVRICGSASKRVDVKPALAWHTDVRNGCRPGSGRGASGDAPFQTAPPAPCAGPATRSCTFSPSQMIWFEGPVEATIRSTSEGLARPPARPPAPPSRPIPSHSMSSNPVPSPPHPIPSRPLSSHRIPSHPVPSRPIPPARPLPGRSPVLELAQRRPARRW